MVLLASVSPQPDTSQQKRCPAPRCVPVSTGTKGSLIGAIHSSAALAACVAQASHSLQEPGGTVPAALWGRRKGQLAEFKASVPACRGHTKCSAWGAARYLGGVGEEKMQMVEETRGPLGRVLKFF